MLIKEKINLDYNGLVEHGAINIVVFGDSVTHGALLSEVNYETVYWNLLKKRLNNYRNYYPVNVINSGIGGITAKGSLPRLDRDVLSYHPDLIIICFGLNDVNLSIEEYLEPMETIFKKCTENCSQVIFMTPNMLNTYVAEDTLERLKDYAKVTAGYQNSGRMDEYIYGAKALAEKCGVTVCDVYSEWKQMEKEGKDITQMLVNRINHPTQEMHKLFADMLYDVIMPDKTDAIDESSTMYKGK